ncbi:MAG: class I SAM-dependent methyltransferase [Dehalococcoidales bacterium]|jgi:SAM-dependent methyltransferase
MDERLKSNRTMWNALVGPHVKSEFYDVAGFKAGKDWLRPLEIEEMGDVAGKSLLHLQCHFGQDTISWGRRGAKATGADFSGEAIKEANKLSRETGVKANFICSDIFALPEKLDEKFDIVYTSYGVIGWLPDINRWGEIVAHFLKPGGFFYIAEIHPLLFAMGEKAEGGLRIMTSYFSKGEPERYEGGADYASEFTHDLTSYEWQFTVGEVVTALCRAGLSIQYLHEFPVCCYRGRPDMYQDNNGWWRLAGDKVPLTFSIKAVK